MCIYLLYIVLCLTKITRHSTHSEVGKVIGGTKGNPVLEYISGAPNKPIVIEDEPNIFDYDQLTKYGYDVSVLWKELTVSSLAVVFAPVDSH